MALFPSRYAGVCLTCQKPYAVGDKIFWTRGMKSGQHALCSDEGKAIHAQIEQSKAADVVGDFNVSAPEGLTYLGYQKAGISYASGRKGSLIADEMGLGKTIQAIGVINADSNIKSVLIVCPFSLKLNWQRELKKWLINELSVGMTNGGCPETDIVIVNFDGLRKHGETLAKRDWDMIVVDECHLIKNPETQRCINVFKVASKAKRRVALTGSPIANRPKELFTILQLVCPEVWDPPGQVKDKKTKQYVQVSEGKGAGFWRFAKRYCNAHKNGYGWDLNGASNLDELHTKLRTSCMIRRLKADVLKELPAKRRQLIEVPSNAAFDDIDAEYRRHYVDSDEAEAEVEIARLTGSDKDYEKAVSRLESAGKIAFTELSRARHAMGLAKVEFAIDHVKDLLENVNKVIVFAHHHDVINALEEGLREFNPVKLTGETKELDRQKHVDSFQQNEKCRVFIGSISAAGVGLTLTAASTVVFVELDWVPMMLSQAEDRAHRIGQRDCVLIQHLTVSGSIDAKLIDTIMRKQAVIEGALDRADDFATIDRPVVVDAKKKEFIEAAKNMTPEKLVEIHGKLRFMAARCDGAAAIDGQGFNKLDSNIGKSLAKMDKLTPKQAALGERILKKYKRQLGEI